MLAKLATFLFDAPGPPQTGDWGAGGEFYIYLGIALFAASAAAVILAVVISKKRKAKQPEDPSGQPRP